MPDRDPAAEILLHHGVVRTMESGQPSASAVLVRGGRIAYVGEDGEARRRGSPGAKVIDLGGGRSLPVSSTTTRISSRGGITFLASTFGTAGRRRNSATGSACT